MQISNDNQKIADQFNEGMDLYYQGEIQKASEIFLDITNQDTSHHKAWNALGVCLKKLGNLKQAHECFKNAIYLSPDNPKYQRNLDILSYDENEQKNRTDPVKKERKKKRNRHVHTNLIKQIPLVCYWDYFSWGYTLFHLYPDR